MIVHDSLRLEICIPESLILRQVMRIEVCCDATVLPLQQEIDVTILQQVCMRWSPRCISLGHTSLAEHINSVSHGSA